VAEPAVAVTGTPLVRLVPRLLNDRRIRYVIVGGIAAAVYYAIFTAGWLLSARQVPYLAMVLVANLGCAVLTYPLYRHGVFGASGGFLRGFLRFYVLCLGSLVFSFAGMPLLVEAAGVPVLVAQAVLIVVWPLFNYQLSKRWAFRR
jgi:putative flippase GtrA